MDTAAFRELLTPPGQAALAAAAALGPTEAGFLATFEKLRKSFPAGLAKAALETALLRERARAKFAVADRLYFTREALEQASGDAAAAHRAGRFAALGEVADLCCGIGADSLALAAAGLTVQAAETDPLLAAMARANAAALGFGDRITVHEADALTALLPGVRAAFADPARRAAGRRYLDPEGYAPPLSTLRGRFPAGFPLGAKVAPGVAWDDIEGLGAEAEFVSVGGELKECVLWFGPLRTAARRATVLPAGVTLLGDEATPLETADIAEYVFDPDPAVVRAGLAGQLGLPSIDHTIAVLTGSEPVASSFVTAYRVELAERYHLRRLNEFLRARRVGRVTPVQRGSKLDAEAVVKRLKLNGPEHRFVILTQVGGESVVIVGERL
jgi:SAM-dependent methyltransferase